MSTVTVNTQSIPNAVMDSHCRTLLNIVAKFFEDPAVQADYLIWHKATYRCTPEELKARQAQERSV